MKESLLKLNSLTGIFCGLWKTFVLIAFTFLEFRNIIFRKQKQPLEGVY